MLGADFHLLLVYSIQTIEKLKITSKYKSGKIQKD